jgi:ATP-dependent DNA helicase RecG
VPLELTTPVKFLKRVGERLAVGLSERGVHTVEDLLYHLPFRYEDRLHPKPLTAYAVGEMASLQGEVMAASLVRTRNAPIFELTVRVEPPKADSEEAMAGLLKAPPPVLSENVKCLWFHGGYLQGKFRVGQRVALYGKLEASRSGAGARPGAGVTRFKMVQPTFEVLPEGKVEGDDAEFHLLEMGRIVPVYESLGGTTPWGAKLTSRWLRRVLWGVFRELEEGGAVAVETLPRALAEQLALPTRMAALRELHFPAAGTSMAELQAARTPAHKRLIFEELFYLELGLELKRRRLRERAGTAFRTDDKVREALKQVLPFKPTGAQKRVLGEIVADMRSPHPMRRLLQGDVGSGKTIVALEAALVAIENGYQAAMMAPTEILATQHYLAARKLLGEAISPTTGKPYRVTLLTGSLDARAKKDARAKIFRGETDLAIGTHALVEEKVEFANLGLVVVDEQHRFGVQQRFQLMRKPGADGRAVEPDVLVMTATPIPRTLALTMYGDLEASVLDELPPGRTPITTRRMGAERSGEVWEFVRKQVGAGRQAYIVYPVIEGAQDDQPELDFAKADDVDASSAKGKRAGKAKLRSATEMHAALGGGPLAGLRLGLLHGRMSTDDKSVTMARFKRGELDVLVATTVIEVGVDVPNATVMVVEHAERFGLAQLHQLRGRVGRGAERSFCVLIAGAAVTPDAEARLDAMVRTQNGFELAEIDLAQRGPGEFFGTRQAGLPEFRVSSLVRDRDLLELAKAEAVRLVESPDPAISQAEREALWARLRQQWQRRYGLVEA